MIRFILLFIVFIVVKERQLASSQDDCDDKVSNCQTQLDQVDYCNSQDDEIKNFFLKQCPKSCGKCEEMTPAKATTLKSPTTKKSACRDVSSLCNRFSIKRQCRFNTFIRNRCRKTCNVCEDSATNICKSCRCFTCLNGGTCLMKNGKPTCTCLSGFAGAHCHFKEETCNDGIQNQDEEGIDCGGSCPSCPKKCHSDSDCNASRPVCYNGLCECKDTSKKCKKLASKKTCKTNDFIKKRCVASCQFCVCNECGECEDINTLLNNATKVGRTSEPRVRITNLASDNLLHRKPGGIVCSLDPFCKWDADTVGPQYAGGQDVKFKVQWVEKVIGKWAKTVMIRTDRHPQALLDARNLKFHGSALDFTKCKKTDRWWRLYYISSTETNVTVMIESYTKTGFYLAETIDRTGVELIQLDKSARTDFNKQPLRAKWGLAIAGGAFSPGQVAGITVLAPFAAVLGALTSATAFPSLAPALAAAGLVNFAAWSTGATAIAAGSAIGGINGAASVLVASVLKKISDTFFVDWNCFCF